MSACDWSDMCYIKCNNQWRREIDGGHFTKKVHSTSEKMFAQDRESSQRDTGKCAAILEQVTVV